jgi:hypothetical protein
MLLDNACTSVVERGHQASDIQNGRGDDLLEAKTQAHQQATVNGHQGMDSNTDFDIENMNAGDGTSNLQDSNDGASDGEECRTEHKGRKRPLKQKHKRWSKTPPLTKRKRSGSLRRKVKKTSDPAQNEKPKSDWITRGSPHVGKRVRRAIIDEDGEEIGYGKGNIVGWWPAHKSDFTSPLTGLPAPLWHLVYDEVCENDIRFAPHVIARPRRAGPGWPREASRDRAAVARHTLATPLDYLQQRRRCRALGPTIREHAAWREHAAAVLSPGRIVR